MIVTALGNIVVRACLNCADGNIFVPLPREHDQRHRHLGVPNGMQQIHAAAVGKT